MPTAGVELKAIESLEQLSEVMIETLKELSSNRQPLSTSFLCQAMMKRQEILNLLDRKAPSVGMEAAEEEPEAVRELKVQARTARTQRDQAIRQADSLREQYTRIQAFCKRSLLTMITLVCASENETDLLNSLEGIKNLLLSDSDIDRLLDRLEGALNDVKHDIMQRELEGEKISAPAPEKKSDGPSLWGRLLRRRDSKGSEPSEAPRLQELQSAYLNILQEFHVDLGRSYLLTYSDIQQRIRESRDFDQLLSVSDDILNLIQTYAKIVNEERSQVTDFIAEIGNNLIEMEKHFLASIAHTTSTHEANSSFNALLEGQMQDIRDSAQLSKTLAEFKGLVISKLSTIKEVLESKSREDRERREEVDREMSSLQQSLSSMKQEIEQAQERSKALEQETLIDPLTGIPNRRAYNRKIKDEFQRYKRYGQAFTLLLFDVDHFKRVNDTYGHRAGDKCLKEIVNRIKSVLRESDFIGRYGGEEFAVILPGTERTNALTAAEKLCRLIEKTRFLYQGQEIPLTISIGGSQIFPDDADSDSLFVRVDKAVYEAKNTGRNRVVLT